MTEQEAIEKIRYRIHTATEIAGKGEDGNIFEDLEMAIVALEKQIPKKPHYDGTFVWDKWLCPNCNSGCELDYDNYCHACGQRLDWSKEDER